MFALVKFVPTLERADYFCEGKLYMNTLDYFWHNGFGAQKDILEGIISTVSPEPVGLPEDFLNHQIADIQYQAVGYAYCNVFCMSQIKIAPLYNTPNGILFDVMPPAGMQEFGEYAVIVDNQVEFLRRINQAAQHYKFLCGHVNYHSPMLNSKEMDKKKHHIILKSQEVFDISQIPGVRARRDAFDKSIVYQSQNEWRLCLYRGEKSTDKFVLDIGDIRDITHVIKTAELEQEILEKGFKPAACNTSDSYYGNISRHDLRELFYKLGDNKAYILSTI